MTLTVSDMLVVLQLDLHNLHESSLAISGILNQHDNKKLIGPATPVRRILP